MWFLKYLYIYIYLYRNISIAINGMLIIILYIYLNLNLYCTSNAFVMYHTHSSAHNVNTSYVILIYKVFHVHTCHISAFA